MPSKPKGWQSHKLAIESLEIEADDIAANAGQNFSRLWYPTLDRIRDPLDDLLIFDVGDKVEGPTDLEAEQQIREAFHA